MTVAPSLLKNAAPSLS